MMEQGQVSQPSQHDAAAEAEQLMAAWIDEMSRSPGGRLPQQQLAPVVKVKEEPKAGQLVYEAMEGNVDGVKRALAEGQSVNTEQSWYARVSKDYDTNDYDGLTAFFAAAVKGHWEVVRVLAQHPGIDIMSTSFSSNLYNDDRGSTWLHGLKGADLCWGGGAMPMTKHSRFPSQAFLPMPPLRKPVAQSKPQNSTHAFQWLPGAMSSPRPSKSPAANRWRL